MHVYNIQFIRFFFCTHMHACCLLLPVPLYIHFHMFYFMFRNEVDYVRHFQTPFYVIWRRQINFEQ